MSHLCKSSINGITYGKGEKKIGLSEGGMCETITTYLADERCVRLGDNLRCVEETLHIFKSILREQNGREK